MLYVILLTTAMFSLPQQPSYSVRIQHKFSCHWPTMLWKLNLPEKDQKYHLP